MYIIVMQHKSLNKGSLDGFDKPEQLHIRTMNKCVRIFVKLL